MQRSRWISGILLIIAGVGILVWKYLPAVMGLGVLCLSIGGVLTVLFWHQNRRQSLFLPVLFVLIGLYFMIAPHLIHPFNGRSHFAFGTLLIGLDALIVAAVNRFRADYLITGFMFTGIGTLFVLRFLHILFSEQLIYMVDTFWPVLLILGGIALVSNAMLKRHHVPTRSVK